MMYIVSYVWHEIGKVSVVKNVGATIGLAERTVIKFACLEDALTIARMIKSKGHDVFVGDTDDSEARYMIPRESVEF